MHFRIVLCCMLLTLSAIGLKSQTYTVKSFTEIDSFLANTNDSLYVINFWATWCLPCVEELPAIERINTENPEVKVILISLDSEKSWETGLQSFIKKNNIGSEVWVIKNPKPIDWIDQVDPRWQGSIPAILFLNNAKQVKVFEEHQFTYEELINQIQSLK